MSFAPYRKFVIAFVAAAVTLAHAFGVANADEIGIKVIAAVDAILALGVYLVPNEPA